MGRGSRGQCFWVAMMMTDSSSPSKLVSETVLTVKIGYHHHHGLLDRLMWQRVWTPNLIVRWWMMIRRWRRKKSCIFINVHKNFKKGNNISHWMTLTLSPNGILDEIVNLLTPQLVRSYRLKIYLLTGLSKTMSRTGLSNTSWENTSLSRAKW